MYLRVTPAGRYGRLDYRFASKRKTMALCVHPEVSLGEARDEGNDARRSLREARDPMSKSAAVPAAPTFREAAEDWYAKRLPG